MSALDARDDLRELADTYETVASLDLTPEPGGVRGVPGSRVPPGAQAILDADEVASTLREVDEWASFLVHVLIDEREAGNPGDGTTPSNLRHIGEWAAHFLNHDDEGLRLSFVGDLKHHHRTLDRLTKRALRHVRTGMSCTDPTCTGQYATGLPRTGRPDDGAITCERCGHRVEQSVWSSWPRARIEWVTAEHAANILGTTVAAVWQRARREKWRRQGLSKQDRRYHVADVRGERQTIPA